MFDIEVIVLVLIKKHVVTMFDRYISSVNSIFYHVGHMNVFFNYESMKRVVIMFNRYISSVNLPIL